MIGQRRSGEAISLKLALTERERKSLKRLMYRVVDDVEVDKNSYRVLLKSDPQFGRLLKDGEDITDREIDEREARAFLRRLG